MKVTILRVAIIYGLLAGGELGISVTGQNFVFPFILSVIMFGLGLNCFRYADDYPQEAK
jgi:hypothetical protein